MALTVFSPNTLIKSAEMNANMTGLSDGTNDATANSLETFRSENVFNHVVSGGVISADSVGVNRNASMTALIGVVSGKRATTAAVVARTYTASRDTYVNQDNTGTLTYTEVTNNNASPALVVNNQLLGIVITGATTIATTGSINQGQTDRILPIASSVPYSVTDSLGNLIYNTNPNPTRIGYRQRLSNFTSATTGSDVDVTELSCPVIVPAGRQIRIHFFADSMATSSAAATVLNGRIKEGATQIAQNSSVERSANDAWPINVWAHPPSVSTGAHTYKAAVQSSTASLTVGASSTAPMFIAVELV